MELKVSERTQGRLSPFWENLQPRNGAEKIWLSWYSGAEGSKPVQHSPKDMVAQAHCVAAYLLNRGVLRGDKVIIISGASPVFLTFDLALQFLGAASICLSASIAPEEFAKIRDEYQVRFIFLSEVETYRRLGELKSMKPLLSMVILGTDEVEMFDLDKLVTFDRVIPQGKHLWRENHDALKQRKASVEPADAFSMYCTPGKNICMLERMDFRTLQQKADEATVVIEKFKPESALNTIPPSRIAHRTAGVYAFMRAGIPLFLQEKEESLSVMLPRHAPYMAVSAAEQVQQLFEDIQKSFSDKGIAKKFERALKIIEKRDAIVQSGGKVPFFLNLRFRFLNGSIFKPVRRMVGGNLTAFICDSKELTAQAERFFRNAGVAIQYL